jgi:hypothetical protein
MATQADVRRIARRLAGTIEADDDFAFAVLVKGKRKGYAWSWKERIDPKKARVPNLGVLAVRVASLDEKDALLAGEPDALFTEPHYHGFPAVLVRLDAIGGALLERLLTNAWRCFAEPAPKASRARAAKRAKKPSASRRRARRPRRMALPSRWGARSAS